MSVRLIKEEPPERAGRGGRGPVDIGPMLKTLSVDAGSWYKYPREYNGYPNGMRKRFTDEGAETRVAKLTNDDGVAYGYALYVRMPPVDDGDTGATEG